MRKNAVNRELTPIEGGVCAVDGFSAGGVACGIREDGALDLAAVLSDKRCPAACVFSTSQRVGAPIIITRKNIKNGYARVVVANGGIANAFLPDGERLAQKMCMLAEKSFHVLREETLVASTGVVGRALSMVFLERGFAGISSRMSADEEGSIAAAMALSDKQAKAGQLSYSFELGDFTCRIGAIFKGSMHVAPNMATTLAFLTTDVCISPKMLQFALATSVKETLNLLNIDGQPSPNDMVCIMANGMAGNCIIDRVDTEYHKFCYALRAVLTEVCRAIAAGENGDRKVTFCHVKGAKSKQLARCLSKKLVGSQGVKNLLYNPEPVLDVESIFYALAELDCVNTYEKVQISLRSAKGELLLFEDGKRLPCSKERIIEVLSEKEVGVCVALNVGNYAACAYGCI